MIWKLRHAYLRKFPIINVFSNLIILLQIFCTLSRNCFVNCFAFYYCTRKKPRVVLLTLAF